VLGPGERAEGAARGPAAARARPAPAPVRRPSPVSDRAAARDRLGAAWCRRLLADLGAARPVVVRPARAPTPPGSRSAACP